MKNPPERADFLLSIALLFPVGRGHRNQGVIAPGNHWILDSLRGAPPRRPRSMSAQANQEDQLPTLIVTSLLAMTVVALAWYH